MDTKGWADIAYNSAICPHGTRFRLRGPGVRSAANGTNAGNYKSVAFVYIGGISDPFTNEAKRGFLSEAFDYGLPLNWIHDDWKNTGCPGPAISDWDRHGYPEPDLVVIPPSTPKPPAPVEVKVGDLLWPTISRADRKRHNPHTRIIQAVVGTKVDGDFFTKTHDKVVGFQRAHGLAADGIVGNRTGTAIIQDVFNIRIDGEYGPQTTQAVIDFQKSVGIAADGLFGNDSTNHLWVRMGRP